MDGSKTDLPSGRMKLTLFGSSPSAIQATFTPAPVMPSERAVGWCGLSESTPISASPSGSSWTWPFLPHAPGITLGVSEVLASVLSADAVVVLATVPSEAAVSGAAPWMVTSGMTSATAELAFSRDSSPADTVAANELISR